MQGWLYFSDWGALQILMTIGWDWHFDDADGAWKNKLVRKVLTRWYRKTPGCWRKTPGSSGWTGTWRLTSISDSWIEVQLQYYHHGHRTLFRVQKSFKVCLEPTVMHQRTIINSDFVAEAWHLIHQCLMGDMPWTQIILDETS